VLDSPFSPWPVFAEDERDAVMRVLASGRVNYWTGKECRDFEREFAQWAGVDHAVSLANGTLALDVALRALGVGPGDEVVVTPRTFLASVSCVVNAGARPVFADVDPDSGNISARTVAPVLTSATKAIICVHLAGWPCEMDGLLELANAQGLKLIEDCAQAHGATYRGRSVGAIGDIGAWSFCQDKIITTGGEGGMVTTRDAALWSSMWSYKDHGKSWDAVYNRTHGPGFRWLHESFGTNWRMLEMQAAIGRLQLRKLTDWTARRRSLAEALAGVARDLPALRVPQVPAHAGHAFYRQYFYVRPDALRPGWTRDRIVDEIRALQVPCFQGTCAEVYLEKAFDGTGLRPTQRLPVARDLGETSLMFLVHPTVTDTEIARACDALMRVMRAACR
jgi:dTDP-4-amino-4,6-dideoxygalactose transaminase